VLDLSLVLLGEVVVEPPEDLQHLLLLVLADAVEDQSPTMLEIYRVREGRITELWALSSLRRDA